MGDTKNFCQMKGLMKILVSFMVIAFVVVELKIFKGSRGDGASMNWAISGGSTFMRLAPEVVFKERKRVLIFFWKILIFTETAR